MSRIWNLRLNVDTFNGAYLKLRSDSERLQYFLGFHLGCMDGESNTDDDRSFLAGFEIGKGMADEARGFRVKQSERGQASASKRRERNGTAQPGRTTPEPPFEPPFDVSPNQSTIHNPLIQETKKPASQGQAGRILCKDWNPDSNHANICSFHKLSLEMQLERFRIKFAAEPVDAPEGWNRRFLGWLARGRPEATFSPIAPTPKPLPAFIQSQITVKEGEKRKYETQGRTQSAKEVQREIDQLKGGTP